MKISIEISSPLLRKIFRREVFIWLYTKHINYYFFFELLIIKTKRPYDERN